MVGVTLIPVEESDNMTILDGVVTYLVHLGQNVDMEQLIAGLPITDGTLPPILLKRVVSRVGHVVSLFALQVYDRVIPSQSQATRWGLAGGVGSAILFEALSRNARAGLVDQVGKSTGIEISGDLFARLVYFLLERLPMPQNAIAHTIREFSAIKAFFSTAADGVVSDLPFVLLSLFVLYVVGGSIVAVVKNGRIAQA